MLRNLEYVACYYVTGSYKTQDYGYCMRTKHYQDLSYAVSFLPYYWRAMQVPNLDRFHDFLFALFDASAIIGTQEVICIYVIL